ncbi:glycoside hydrolase family 1 protein [Actinomyces lilanjuaniae]|uniref:Glycoside hydrolase family 1 protein n=1 Tax=Actinomyces lilanjuaniae TaxID=2321394 RepID=A0ABN5PQR8_9ACTO|nr:family 1 glycosylhydrolase [Actinomyces lilanjuaniae]AYD90521.1 glycoside hydrolase family 1 protein [Actinomyces lilanjuaniae]
MIDTDPFATSSAPSLPLSVPGISSATPFPEGFLWGAATASHQVEGGNTNNDVWLYEHVPGTMYTESSGDACDHFTRYRQDIALLASLGLNAYRFSLEWSRIEPAPGEFSAVAVEHYRDVLRACHEHGLTPLVTYHHFTSPQWLIARGGWEDTGTPALFARYCRHVTEELGDLFDIVCTMNEPNLAVLLAEMGMCETEPSQRLGNPTWEGAAAALGTTPDRVAGFQLSATKEAYEVKLAAHRAAVEAIKAVRPAMQVGWTLANSDFHAAPGGEEQVARVTEENNLRYLRASQGDDFVGLQTYNRTVLGPEGPVPPEPGATLNQGGEEIWPWAVGAVVRQAWDALQMPIYVTENGLNTEDDTQRVDFLRTAIGEVGSAIAEGVDVRGYMCWSAMDNFEWVLGYGPRFGIIAVDRSTQERTPKPSAYVLGEIARTNGACLGGD